MATSALKINLVTAIFAVFLSLFMVDISAQNRPPDREITYRVRFARGKSSSVIKKQIRLGTIHIFTLRAQRGQNMKVVLTTGNKTSFTIYSPTEGRIEDADGVKTWDGTLSETGEYRIAVGTDKTADYTLEIFVI